MKLIEYTTENTCFTSPRLPHVRIGKSGLFGFNKEAVELLGVTSESSVTISMDEDSPRDFYIKVTSIPTAFKLRGKGNSHLLQFNCVKVAKQILAINKEEKSASFRISKEKILLGGGYLLFDNHGFN